MSVAIETDSFGAGPGLPILILILHEGLGSLAMWKDFPARLAAETGSRVIGWSRRGYGQSAPFERAYAADFMHREADAAAQLMDDLGIARAHIFGHSDGASIALLVAARHPDRVASLILEAPHIFVEPMCIAAIQALEPKSEALIARLARYHRDARAVFHQWFHIWTDPDFPLWTIEAETAGISCPILAIQGDDDEYGTYAQLERLSAVLPQTAQLRLTSCRHSPHRDCEAEVLQAATKFYRECGAPS